MGRGDRDRACNTIIVGHGGDPYVPYETLEPGQAFIRRNPTNPNNPCVYYKHTESRAIHQNGRGSTIKTAPDLMVRRIEVVEQHIVLLEPNGTRSS